MSSQAELGPEDEIEVLETVEFSDSDSDNQEYAAVHLSDSEGSDSDEDLVSALTSLSKSKRGSPAAHGVTMTAEPRSQTEVRPSVVDDFIRNFLIKVGMERTLDSFNTEWYELQSKGKLGEEYTNPVPDIYLRNQELDEQVVSMRRELEKMQAIAAKAKGTWDKFRKERDFHRMHHKRVVQEKDKLTLDLKHLHKHYLSYEPALKELQVRFACPMK